MEQIPQIAPEEAAQYTAAPIAPAPDPDPQTPDESALMKRAYNRGGLAILAMYESLQTIGSVFLVAASVIVALLLIMPQLHGIEELSMPRILSLLRETGGMGWVIAVYAIGSVVGIGVGVLIMQKILTPRIPIEKHRLSVGRFAVLALMTFGLWGVGAAIGNLPAFLGVTESNGMEELLKGVTFEAIPLYLYVMIGAPIFEELACRKLLLDRLHPYGEGYAAVVSGLLFGLIHGNSGQFFLAFLIGMLFAMIYMRTGRILYTMLLHGMINVTATLPELFALGGIDIELGWNIAVGALVLAGLVTLLVCRKDPILHPRKSPAYACRAAWRNVGMILLRVLGLVTLVFVDLMMLIGALTSEQGPLACTRLVLTLLAVVTVLVLPSLTERLFTQQEMTEDGFEVPDSAA